MSEVEISEKGRQERLSQWEKIGLDRIKHDLLDGRYRVVGGPLPGARVSLGVGADEGSRTRGSSPHDDG